MRQKHILENSLLIYDQFVRDAKASLLRVMIQNNVWRTVACAHLN